MQCWAWAHARRCVRQEPLPRWSLCSSAAQYPVTLQMFWMLQINKRGVEPEFSPSKLRCQEQWWNLDILNIQTAIPRHVGNETGFTFPAFSSRTFPWEFPRKIQVCFEAWNIWNSPVHLSMKSIHATTCACWGPWYLDQFALASVTLVMFHPRLGEAAGLDLSFWSLSIHS